MTAGLIGRKVGMTRVFTDDGSAVPVTVIEAGPCWVMQVGSAAVQLGYGNRKPSRATKPELGHAKRAGLDAAPQVVRSFPVRGEAPKAGDTVTVGIFSPGELVKVTGTSKGRGFQGVVHRHGFGGGPATHGNTRHRKPGSIGPGTDPRVGDWVGFGLSHPCTTFDKWQLIPVVDADGETVVDLIRTYF